MAFLVSPGVQVREIDLTNVVPAGATSIGKALGNYNINLTFLQDNIETSKFALF